MSEPEKLERYPKNAPGPFFVENGLCIACGVPELEAPDLMTHDEDPEVVYHCYFHRQPSTPAELEQAISAVWISCCGAVQYDGDDPYVLQRLQELEEKSRLAAEIYRQCGRSR